MGDVAGGTSDDLDVTAAVENRAKNIFVVACDSRGAGVGRFVGQPLLGVKNLLNLCLQALGQVGRIFQFVKILADGFFQFQAPQIEQGLIHETETALAIENISEIGNRGQRDIEDVRLAVEPKTQVVGFTLGSSAVGDVDNHAGKKPRFSLFVAFDFSACFDPGDRAVSTHDAVAFLEAIFRAFQGFGDGGGEAGRSSGWTAWTYFSRGPPAASFAFTPKSVAKLRSAMTRSLTMSQVQVATSLAKRTDCRRWLASRRSFSVRVRERAAVRDGFMNVRTR